MKPRKFIWSLYHVSFVGYAGFKFKTFLYIGDSRDVRQVSNDWLWHKLRHTSRKMNQAFWANYFILQLTNMWRPGNAARTRMCSKHHLLSHAAVKTLKLSKMCSVYCKQLKTGQGDNGKGWEREQGREGEMVWVETCQIIGLPGQHKK